MEFEKVMAVAIILNLVLGIIMVSYYNNNSETSFTEKITTPFTEQAQKNVDALDNEVNKYNEDPDSIVGKSIDGLMSATEKIINVFGWVGAFFTMVFNVTIGFPIELMGMLSSAFEKVLMSLMITFVFFINAAVIIKVLQLFNVFKVTR